MWQEIEWREIYWREVLGWEVCGGKFNGGKFVVGLICFLARNLPALFCVLMGLKKKISSRLIVLIAHYLFLLAHSVSFWGERSNEEDSYSFAGDSANEGTLLICLQKNRLKLRSKNGLSDFLESAWLLGNLTYPMNRSDVRLTWQPS